MRVPQYYPCWVEFNGRAIFLVWYAADLDGLLRNSDGQLVIADSLESLDVPLTDLEPVEYYFDHIRAWCAAPNAAGVDCPAFLNAWNFFDDLTGLHAGADTPYTRLSRAAVGEYNKLFWGNNLPSVTPPGEHFHPMWAPEELEEIRHVFEAGLSVLASELSRPQ